MNQKVLYSVMGLSVVSGATLQAAVFVPVEQEEKTATQVGESWEVTVPFGTLAPGKYTLSGIVTDGSENATAATLAGKELSISSGVISGTITISELTENAKLVISGTNTFKLGVYSLKLEWEPDDTKDALNALLGTVRTKVETTMDGLLTDAHKTGFKNQLDAQATAIAGLEVYADYLSNELWKVGDEENPDKISAAINAIETEAEATCLADRWAAKVALYNAALAAIPSDAKLNTLQDAINALAVNKDKRQDSYGNLVDLVTAYKDAAADALDEANKPESWDAEEGFDFEFEPDPSADDITAGYNELNGYVATDKANAERYAAMTASVDAATASVGEVDTDLTKNLTARAANEAEKQAIIDALADYAADAEDDFNVTTENDGEEFDFDPDLESLEELGARITALSEQITVDNEAYDEAKETVDGLFEDAAGYYPEKMTELADNVTDQDILEQAQTALLVQKNALANLQDEYDAAYEAGEDIVPTDANNAINAVKANMDGIVNKATFDSYKVTMQGEVEALAEDGDSEASQQIIADAVAAIEALEYDEEKTLEENKAAVDNIFEPVADELDVQRAADQLAADKAEFADYKTAKMDAADAMAEEGDSDAATQLITDVKDAIEALDYDEGKTLAQNKAAVDAILAPLADQLEAQRAIDQLNAWKDEFADYQTEQIEALDAKRVDGNAMIDGLVDDAIDEINALDYDEDMTLEENKAEVDEIVEAVNPEITAACLVEYINDLVKTNYGTLRAAVVASQAENTGKMLDRDAAIEEDYDVLLGAIDEIEDARAEIEAAPIQDDEFEEDPETGELVNTTNYPNNTYVKKVNSYNALLTQIGKTTDTEGSLYADFKGLKSSADASAAAKKANDDAFTALTAELDDLQGDLDEAKTGIEDLDEYVQNKYAGEENRIQGLINADRTALGNANTEQTLTANSTNANAAAVASAITKLSADAAAAQAAYEVSEAAYAELVKDFDPDVEGSLQAQLDDAKEYINENDGDVAASFADAIDGIQDEIDEAKAALDDARDNSALTETSTIANKSAIENEIANLKVAADKKQAKYNSNNTLTAQWSEVSIYLAEQRSLTVEAAGEGAKAYYRDKFNGQGGFVEQLNTIKDEIAAAFSDESVGADEFLSTYQTKLNNVKAEIGKVLGLAAANKASYDAQMEAYANTVDFYNEKYTELTTEYEQDYVEAEIEAMEDFSPENGDLKDAQATIENNYVAGSATTVENLVLTGILPDIVSGIQAILDGLDAENSAYYQAIAASNLETLNEVIETIQGIRVAYNSAVKALENKDFKGATDEDLADAIAAEAETLSEAVFGAIQQQTDFNSRANQISTDKTAAREVWDATDFITEVEDYIAGLEAAQEAFTANVKAAITDYWNGVKTNSEAEIDYLFGRLDIRGYIQNEETKEGIFEDAYGAIDEGDAIVDEEEGSFNISALEAKANGDLSNESLVGVANAFAQGVAQAAVNEYTKAGGKKDVAWAEIVEIFGDHDVNYGQPDGEDSMEDQFANIVAGTIEQAQANAANVTYNTRLSTAVTNRLANFDALVDNLKATAQQWVDNQEAADAALAEAQGELTEVRAELKTLVDEAQEAYEALKAQVEKTSVAGDYAEMLNDIRDLISAANEVATATNKPETLAAVNEAKNDVANQKTIITTGDVPYLMTAVEQGVIDDLKVNLGLLIPDLKAQFNEYAATDNPDDATLTDWNERIQNAIKLTGADNPSTLDDMIKLEEDLAKLRTEMGDINGDVAETITDFENRTQALLDATLDEADYGNRADEFNNRLEDIQTAAADIAAEVAQHEADGDILPYIDNLEGRIEAQEAALEALLEDAANKAGKVSANKSTYAGWQTTLNELMQAELVPEVNYENYGEEPDAVNGLAARLETICSAAKSILAYIEAEGRYDYFVNLDDATTHQVANSINFQQGRWDALQADAAAQAEAWAAQKEASNAIYAQLKEQVDAIMASIEEAVAAIGDYSEGNMEDYLGQLADLTNKGLLAAIEAEKDAYTLDEEDLDEENEDSYINKLSEFGDQVTPIWNEAAQAYADALYFSENSDLQTAQNDAWTVWEDWTFSATVKTQFEDNLNTIDDEVGGFYATIQSDEDAYEKLADYAETAKDLIAKYKAQVAEMNGYAKFGDANVDGKVNVLDYQTVVNMILDPTQQPADDSKLFSVIDINHNTVIEVGDLAAIVKYILNGDWQGWAAVKALGQANESLTMDITQVQQGVQRYAINLQNVEDYTAFQLDVVLPEGMTIVGSSLSQRAGKSHKLWSRAQMDGSVRLLASSVKGDTFSGNEGAVLYIDVQTDANFKGGSVEMMNILFSDVNAQTRAFAIGNGGEATGIDIMAAMQSLKQKVYDLGGRVMNGMRKGVNIIQNADGTTKKVLK